jgi:HAD superfamily hydrolase (TIGR01509 family)
LIRNLIWDVDGTLFDTYPSIVQSYLRALESFGGSEATTYVLALARVGLTNCAHVLAARHRLDEDELAERFSLLYRAVPKVDQPPFDGVKQVCQAILAGGGINAIVTHRGRASTEQMLTTHHMRYLFVEIAAGDDGLPRKPDPAAFLVILGKTGVDRKETAAVGDREVDIRAGKAAGLWTCLFWPEEADTPAVDADFIFSEYTELSRYLGGHPPSPGIR